MALTFLHSGDCGDLIASLNTVKLICEQHHDTADFYIDITGGLTANSAEINEVVNRQTQGKGLRLKKSEFEFLEPLISHQKYISSCQLYDANSPQIQYNLNSFRLGFINPSFAAYTNQNLDLCHKIQFGLPLNWTGPWLSCDKIDLQKPSCITRTTRYTSAHLFIAMQEKVFRESYFIGTQFEHEVFKNAFAFEPEYYPVKNALDAAIAINSAKMYFSNGTLMYWIAVGLGHPNLIHELAVDIPTTHYKDNPNIRYVQGGHFVR